MGSRYGRNRKRKHQAEIARLEKEVTQRERVEKTLRSLLDTARAWDQEISYLLGPNSAFRLKTREQEMEKMTPEMRAISYLPISPIWSNVDIPLDLSVTYQRLYPFMLEIQRNPETYRPLIKLFVKDKYRSAIYVSEEYFERVGLTERDICYLADDLVRQLTWHAFGASEK